MSPGGSVFDMVLHSRGTMPSTDGKMISRENSMRSSHNSSNPMCVDSAAYLKVVVDSQ